MLGFGALGQFALGQFGVSDTFAPSGAGGIERDGFDPYRYKRRNRRRKTEEDVRAFVEETRDIVEAPEDIARKAEVARLAAEAYLAREAEASAAELRDVLSLINQFYALLRAEIKRREEEEDDEFLLLSS